MVYIRQYNWSKIKINVQLTTELNNNDNKISTTGIRDNAGGIFIYAHNCVLVHIDWEIMVGDGFI